MTERTDTSGWTGGLRRTGARAVRATAVTLFAFVAAPFVFSFTGNLASLMQDDAPLVEAKSSPVAALIASDDELRQPACSGARCTIAAVKPQILRLPDDAGLEWTVVDLVPPDDTPRVYEASAGSRFTKISRLPDDSRAVIVVRGSPGHATYRQQLMEQAWDDGTARPVFPDADGYVAGWNYVDDAPDAPLRLITDPAEKQARVRPYRRVAFMPVPRLLRVSVSGPAGQRIEEGLIAVLHMDPRGFVGDTPPNWNFSHVTARVHRVERKVVGRTEIQLEPLPTDDRFAAHWMTTIAKAAGTAPWPARALAHFRPARAFLDDNSIEVESRGLIAKPRSPTFVVASSAVDRACSADGPSGTACVWTKVGGAVVPVQVRVNELNEGTSSVIERPVFAGKAVSAAHWQRLPASARREWLTAMDGNNASILAGREVFVEPRPDADAGKGAGVVLGTPPSAL